LVSSRFQKQKQENDLLFFLQKRKILKYFLFNQNIFNQIFERFVFLESGKTTTLKHQIPHTKLNRFLIRENTKTSNPYKNQITRIKNQTPNSIFQDKNQKKFFNFFNIT
jgi:hypothetical protein